MALSFCPECGGKVSDTAAACPHCAYSFQPAQAGGAGVTTIQQTGQVWKLIQMIGVLFIVGALISLAFDGAPSGIILIIGLVLWVYAKIQAWWNHG